MRVSLSKHVNRSLFSNAQCHHPTAGTQWNIPTNEETDNKEEGSFFLDNEDRENAREHFELAAQAGDAIAEAWLERERRAETHNS